MGSKRGCHPEPFWIHLSPVAEVVELVDTLGSGSSGHQLVGVRISPSAPHRGQRCTRFVYAEVAQSVEQGTENSRVSGSIPFLGTNKFKGLGPKGLSPFFYW